jgi:hypothetical protein
VQENELSRSPTPAELNAYLSIEKGAPKSTPSYSRCGASTSMQVVRIYALFLPWRGIWYLNAIGIVHPLFLISD